MNRYINYNNDNGKIIKIIRVSESDLSLNQPENTSFLCISSLSGEIDVNNSVVSGSSIFSLSDFPATYDTLLYSVSSSSYISLSSIPDETDFVIYKSQYDELSSTDFNQLTSGTVDDNILEISFDTTGFYKIEFDNVNFNNLTQTFILTAI